MTAPRRATRNSSSAPIASRTDCSNSSMELSARSRMDWHAENTRCSDATSSCPRSALGSSCVGHRGPDMMEMRDR